MFYLLAGCEQTDQPKTAVQAKSYQGIIVAMGDSLTAGLGVSEQKSYPEQLKQLLASSGLHFDVINSGVSGETSSGAKARVDWVLKLKPDIVILETGANDGLRGIEPKLIEENIRSIIETLLARNVTVVLTGMQMVTNLGPDYLKTFNQMYPKLAADYPVIFMPFFLEDVAARPEFNQPDGIHPNGEGYSIVAENILPYVKEAIISHRSSQEN
jgi:acyl-CoA thioesterase-1